MKIAILFLLVTLSVSAQKRIDTVYMDSKMFIIHTPLYKGAAEGVRTWFQDGKMYLSQKMEMGVQSGKEFYFYDNGKVEIESEFLSGFLHGPQRTYEKNGTIKNTVYFWYGTKINKDLYTELRRNK